MVGLSKKRVFPKTKGDSITGQDRAQKHCDFRFSQIEKKSKVAVLQLLICLICFLSSGDFCLFLTVSKNSFNDNIRAHNSCPNVLRPNGLQGLSTGNKVLVHIKWK